MRGRALLLLVLGLAAPVAGRADAAHHEISRLAWLEGVWAGTRDGVDMEEHWSSPAGGGLVGMHKDTRNGRMIAYEFFRIVPGDSGGVCYLTSPLGAAPTSFCAIEMGPARVVFENREHDFPQRILYWLDAKGRLNARIEGMLRGVEASDAWVWSRRPAK